MHKDPSEQLYQLLFNNKERDSFTKNADKFAEEFRTVSLRELKIMSAMIRKNILGDKKIGSGLQGAFARTLQRVRDLGFDLNSLIDDFIASDEFSASGETPNKTHKYFLENAFYDYIYRKQSDSVLLEVAKWERNISVLGIVVKNDCPAIVIDSMILRQHNCALYSMQQYSAETIRFLGGKPSVGPRTFFLAYQSGRIVRAWLKNEPPVRQLFNLLSKESLLGQ